MITNEMIAKLDKIEDMSVFYQKFKKIYDRYKKHSESEGRLFEYTINPDYDNLTITIEMTYEPDDYTKGNPELN